MTTLREIRRKLRSVHNIQKITQAMEMVAASRLRKAQEKAEKTRPYNVQLTEMLDYLTFTQHDFVHPLTQARPVKKICYIVISADKGLCGSYNSAIISQTEKALAQVNDKEVELILFGRKAIDYFSQKKWKIQAQFHNWGGKISFQEVSTLANQLITDYLTNKYDEIWLFYTHYVNIISRQIKVEKLLNIDPPTHLEGNKPLDYIFEPDAYDIFSEILPHYCLVKISSALDESYASELAARIFSMRAATKNADEMIKKLTLTGNKIRQTSITRELIEITAGVESLK